MMVNALLHKVMQRIWGCMGSVWALLALSPRFGKGKGQVILEYRQKAFAGHNTRYFSNLEKERRKEQFTHIVIYFKGRSIGLNLTYVLWIWEESPMLGMMIFG